MDSVILKKIRFFAVENAFKYKGMANMNAVLGKILTEFPNLKNDVKGLSHIIQEAIKDVNSMPFEKIKEEYEQNKPKGEKPHEVKKKKTLPELPNAEMGKFVTRIAPEPSKYNHIGHALSFIINYRYAQKYRGKCILRFEDTNPEKSSQEYVDAMLDDVLNYLEIKPDSIHYVSDDLPILYKMAEKLIEMGKAYVCICDREVMHQLREKGEACLCISKRDAKSNLEEWKRMLSGKFEEGQAILRLSGNMKSPNLVMRDPVLFRINKSEHYRQGRKYCVWPLYDFENAVEDSLNGVTHILRSSEFGEMRIELQNYIKELLGLKKQEILQYGRFNIAGATTKGREIRELIKEGKVSGWDDPSLVTLKALRRRGIVKETFYELIYEIGLSPSTSKNIDWTLISSINRSILDKKADRHFFVDEPVKIEIENAPEQQLELKLHPDFPERGTRHFETGKAFYISKSDYEKFREGDMIRLMDCLNFTVLKNKFLFHSKEHENYKKNGKMIIQWLPAAKNFETEIKMPEGSVKKGLAEEHISRLRIGEVIQFTRFGFCRLEKRTRGKAEFIFAHK